MPQKMIVEVRDTPELDEALALRPDFILLDKMTVAQRAEAVARVGGA
jgi:nicotinate-nucleotide pyrophosphorylase